MTILIRPATMEDAPLIAAAEREVAITPGLLASLPSELTDKKFEDTLSKIIHGKQGQYLVATQGNIVVGHAFLEPLHLKTICHVAHLTIVVHVGWQGKGIGKLLLENLITWAKKSQEIEKIELHVRASNTRAIGLYKKMGFQQEGCLRKRLKIGKEQYVDDILMALFVTE